MTDLTKDRILDAAEQLFAENGVAGTSLRTIMKVAGANMAAIHYHFGSREGLLEALLIRRATPINNRRIEMLDAAERNHPAGPIPAREVARAFCLPVIDLIEDPTQAHVGRLIGRLTTEPANGEAMLRVFGPTMRRFVAAIGRVAPQLSEEECRRRFHFMVGAMVFALSIPHLAPANRPAVNVREVVQELITFVAAGLSAPESPAAGKESP